MAGRPDDLPKSVKNRFLILIGCHEIATKLSPKRPAFKIANRGTGKPPYSSFAAANWQVPRQQCLADGGAIAHPPSGNRVSYKRWVDIV